MEGQCKLLNMGDKPILRKPLPVLTLAYMHQRWAPGGDGCCSSEGTHCIKAALDPDQTCVCVCVCEVVSVVSDSGQPYGL